MLPNGRERRVDGPKVEPLRLEAAGPDSHLLELGVARGEEDFEQPGVAVRSAAVFGRTSPRSPQAARPPVAVALIPDVLDFDGVATRAAGSTGCRNPSPGLFP